MGLGAEDAAAGPHPGINDGDMHGPLREVRECPLEKIGGAPAIAWRHDVAEINDLRAWMNAEDYPVHHPYELVLQPKIGEESNDWHGEIIPQTARSGMGDGLKQPITLLC